MALYGTITPVPEGKQVNAPDAQIARPEADGVDRRVVSDFLSSSLRRPEATSCTVTSGS